MVIAMARRRRSSGRSYARLIQDRFGAVSRLRWRMAQKSMPGILVALLLLMGLGVVANLVNGFVLSAVMGGALVFGVIIGNNGVRTFLRALAVLQIALAVFVVAMASVLAGSGVLVIAAIFGVGVPAFYFYTLGRDDVRDWMFRKNFHVDDDAGDAPQL